MRLPCLLLLPFGVILSIQLSRPAQAQGIGQTAIRGKRLVRPCFAKTEHLKRRNGFVTSHAHLSISTEEIEWQIQMDEKYGPAIIPDHEIKARDAARVIEDKRHDLKVRELLRPPYPEA